MKSRLLIISCLLVLAVSPVARNLAAADLDSCNERYYQADYDQAIECYHRLGNAGAATLFYLRSLYLAPGDADAAGNLALLRKHHGIFPPEPSLGEQLTALLTISQWSLVSLAGLLIYLGFALLSLKKRPRRSVDALLLLLCLLLFGARHHHWQRAVVMTDGQLVVSPFAEATPVGAIRQGRLVSTHARHRDFTSVTDETGRTGWLPTDSLEAIIPPR